MASFVKGELPMETSPYEETVEWRATAQPIAMTPVSRLVFWCLVTVSVIAAASAVAIAQTTHASVTTLLCTAAWSFTFAMAQRFVPQWWHQRAELVITDRRVIFVRGSSRRSIERAGISFARIHWYRGTNVGDLELVRDVPTGVLGRKLSVVFRGVAAPDRVWEHIRGGPPGEPGSAPTAPAGQRLQAGEAVVWTDRPQIRWRRVLPTTPRQGAALALALVATFGTVTSLHRGMPAAKLVLRAGVPALSTGFVALVLALALTTALLLATGASLFWTALVARAARDRSTRYLVTDRRVVITQGDDELQLDRSRIVDLIETRDGDATNVFLILDGPRARAVATSGAFEAEADEELRPVLRGVVDADSVRRILVPRAA